VIGDDGALDGLLVHRATLQLQDTSVIENYYTWVQVVVVHAQETKATPQFSDALVILAHRSNGTMSGFIRLVHGLLCDARSFKACVGLKARREGVCRD
jgi:hypothetical protein